jgi:hypothetical protein
MMLAALASSPQVRLRSSTNTQGLPSYRLTYIAFVDLSMHAPHHQSSTREDYHEYTIN